MPLDINNILIPLVGLAAGTAIGLFVLKPRVKDFADFEEKAKNRLAKGTEEAKSITEEATIRSSRLKISCAEDEKNLKEQFKRLENLIIAKTDHIQKKTQKTTETKTVLEQETKILEALRQKNQEWKKTYILKLTQKTGQSADEIKEEILQELRLDLELAREDRLHKYEEYLNEEKMHIAKNMITAAIQRYAAPTSVEKKNLTITLPRDEIKGRILGKNAEHLLLIEELTSVDIIFNDTPNTIIVSCFDLVKKHIARELIYKLTIERHVTPDKIHQKLKEALDETERTLIKIGRDTVKKLELENRNFPPDFLKIIGRLQFRTSYGQNILKHSYEVGNFTLILGNELGLNMETCKVGGFFHDLGKAIDQEVGGSHDVLTKEIMEKYNFPEDEIHAAWTHHDAIPQRTAEAMLVKAGDAISAGRPGARQESIEKYIERIKAIETISNSYEGVNKAFAISAGREVRVIVEPAKLSDEDLEHLAKNIAVEIQENVAYPGKIKVNVIRRTQSNEYAKVKAKRA